MTDNAPPVAAPLREAMVILPSVDTDGNSLALSRRKLAGVFCERFGGVTSIGCTGMWVDGNSLIHDTGKAFIVAMEDNRANREDFLKLCFAWFMSTKQSALYLRFSNGDAHIIRKPADAAPLAKPFRDRSWITTAYTGDDDFARECCGDKTALMHDAARPYAVVEICPTSFAGEFRVLKVISRHKNIKGAARKANRLDKELRDTRAQTE